MTAAGNTRSGNISLDDELTTLFLYMYDAEEGNGAVTLYELDDCEGRSRSFYATDGGPKYYS